MKPRDRRLLASVDAARRPLVATVLIGLAVALLTVVQAALLAHVIAAGAAGAGLAALRDALVALLAVLVARSLAAGAFELVGRRGAAAVCAQLRERLARHVLVDDPGAAGRTRSGELATVAVTGVDALEAYFARYLPQLVLAVAVPVLVLAWLVRTDLLPALLLAGTLPLVPVFMVLVGRATVEHTTARFRTLTLLGAHFLDVVRGLPVLRAFGREAAQAQTLATVGDRLRTETLATLRVAFLSALVLELLAMLGTALAAVTIGIQLAGGALTLQAGLTVLILAPELFLPLREVGAQFHASADGLEAAERLTTVTAEPVPAPVARVAGEDAVIRADRVGFAHPGREAVLRDVSLQLGPQPGLVAVTGPSGAGKTTLVRLLLGLLHPDNGTVSWTTAADCLWVPQRPTTFAATVRENLLLAGGSLPDLDWLPDVGLDERVGDGGRTLSAGEAQRLAVARAFACRRPIVVCDEPTANLDGTLAERVGAALEGLARERVVCVVTHDEALAARADHRLQVAGGVVRRLEAVPA